MPAFPEWYDTLRQIHLDFHTPDFVAVGAQFDAVEFFDTLEAAGVNSLVVFALCHHGNSYFDTATGRRLPGLSFDLFGAIADECAKRPVQLLAYFSQNVNEVQARLHPEWAALHPDGSPVDSQTLQDGSELFWTWLCPNRGGLIDAFFLPHVREVLETYPVDGVFVDMPGYLPESCFCAACLAKMAAAGLDPRSHAEHGRFNAETNQQVARDLRALMDRVRPGLRLEMGPFNAFGEAEKAHGVLSEFYLESLAFQTGWQYFPMAARYFRKYGLPCVGITGRFLKNWGDFGTVASPAQLKVTLGMHLLAGLASCIGDHLPHSGTLDPALYAAIGDAFRFIEPRQPYCVGMAPRVDAAVLVPQGEEANAATNDTSSPYSLANDAYKGACKMLIEEHYQYALVSPGDPLDAYNLLVVTNGFFGMAFVEQVRAFLERGGTLVASAHGLAPTDDAARAAWQAMLGVTACAPSADQGEFIEATDARARSEDLPAFPHYLHVPAVDVAFTPAVEPLAVSWRSACVRARAHHYGHFHGPADHVAGPAVGVTRVGAGAAILIAPQLFAAYLHTGYFAHRALLRNLLASFQPADARALRTNAPGIVELSLGDKDGRLILQAQPFIAARRDRYSFESICDDPIPLRDIWVEIPGDGCRDRAWNPVTGDPVAIDRAAGSLCVYLPEFTEHLLVVIE
ncbi:MAG TPA: hypothetical protein PK794_00855 [Armatimonadota bacterium]|nr:hypothetical protein [Armatimonadota bacterium]